MTAGRPKSHATARNIELVHELVCNHKTQAAVAARYGVSQPRVALVRRQVAQWVERLVAPVLEQVAKLSPAHERRIDKRQIDRGRQLHLAIAIRRHQLMHAYGEYLAFFGGPAVVLQLGPLLDAWEAGTLSEDITARLPPRHFVRSAVQMARELDTLARIASHGPFFDLPRQIGASECQTDPPSLPDSNSTASPQEASV